jgi:hypothetical protein
MFAIMRLPLLIFLLFSLELNGQQLFKNAEIGLQVNYGSFFTSSSKADFVKDSYTYFGSFSLAKPLRNFPLPRHTYPPQWGASVFFGNTGSKQYIGKMGGAYGFLDFGVFGFKNFSIRARTGLGLGMVEFPYDAENNHKNVVIGSKLNLFIHALIKTSLRINSKWNLEGGVSISHLSNATMKLPNLGLNIPAFTAGISTYINQAAFEHVQWRDSLKKHWNILFQLTAGTKQSPWVNSKHYSQFVFTSEFLFQPTRFGRFGAGIGLHFDPSQQHQFIDSIITVGIKNYSSLNVSSFVEYEIILGKTSIPVQLGLAITDVKKRIYQNYGVRYRINSNFSIAGYLRTHGGTAEFLHGGITYHLK